MLRADISRRLERAEAKAQGDVLAIVPAILAARHAPPSPTHTREELEALATAAGATGRIARGWLRIGFIAERSTGMPAIDPAVVLPQMAGLLYADPLAFVVLAFDWGHEAALRVVKLPDEYRARFDSEFGPDTWACELLDDIGRRVRDNAFDGRTAVDAIRMAVSSGHGIGKSAVTSWIVGWIMSTRPNARGVVTANTAQQLESKTWAEVQKWNRRSLFGEWFTITTGKGAMRMMMRDHPESWRCDAQTCREENSESFAGLHAADSTPFYLYDEASAVPAKIWQVSEGGLTDGEPMWFAFGNPTRNTGQFHEAFNGQRHRWVTKQIDSRTVAITNKKLIGEWIADYGEDSDFVKVRVRGVFPNASSLQFISRDLVDSAMRRELPASRGEIVVVAVDPARFGDDSSVIFTRVGRDGRTFPPIRLRGVDTMQLASRVAEHVNMLRRGGHQVLINIDGGGVGGGVIDRLRSLRFDVNEIQFGSRALDPRKFANRRAEIWSATRDWLAGGALPDDEDLATDLCSVEYGFTSIDQILLESKQSMKARGLASPDCADALAVSLALPTPIVMPSDLEPADATDNDRLNWDPIAEMIRRRETLPM